MRRIRERRLLAGCLTGSISVLAAGAFCRSVRAEDATTKVEGSVGVVFNSKYIWRGQSLVDGPVLQAQGCLTYAGRTGTGWGNYDLDEGDEWTALDYTLDYTATNREFDQSK